LRETRNPNPKPKPIFTQTAALPTWQNKRAATAPRWFLIFFFFLGRSPPGHLHLPRTSLPFPLSTEATAHAPHPKANQNRPKETSPPASRSPPFPSTIAADLQPQNRFASLFPPTFSFISSSHQRRPHRQPQQPAHGSPQIHAISFSHQLQRPKQQPESSAVAAQLPAT